MKSNLYFFFFFTDFFHFFIFYDLGADLFHISSVSLRIAWLMTLDQSEVFPVLIGGNTGRYSWS